MPARSNPPIANKGASTKKGVQRAKPFGSPRRRGKGEAVTSLGSKGQSPLNLTALGAGELGLRGKVRRWTETRNCDAMKGGEGAMEHSAKGRRTKRDWGRYRVIEQSGIGAKEDGHRRCVIDPQATSAFGLGTRAPICDWESRECLDLIGHMTARRGFASASVLGRNGSGRMQREWRLAGYAKAQMLTEGSDGLRRRLFSR
ncbi:hypothetical protein BCM02_12520 [Paenibacillus methanolicus]|uniref:Uncharacterized protein n=1 Tax=Paenibacillus methanolicus TaxID=582686 RepID=A0A5S5BK11_9BACL|nr:hypothetical protein BCM02_12520 [Paenibacillus methanolicus]